VFATIGFETFCFSAKLFYIPVELYYYLSYQFSFSVDMFEFTDT